MPYLTRRSPVTEALYKALGMIFRRDGSCLVHYLVNDEQGYFAEAHGDHEVVKLQKDCGGALYLTRTQGQAHARRVFQDISMQAGTQEITTVTAMGEVSRTEQMLVMGKPVGILKPRTIENPPEIAKQIVGRDREILQLLIDLDHESKSAPQKPRFAYTLS